jgi:hypothetical protein
MSEPNPWEWRGHKDAHVLACGDSHRYALLDAIGQGVADVSLRGAVLSQITPGHRETDDLYWDMVADSACSRSVAILWGGNRHNRFMLKPSQSFTLAYGQDQTVEDHGDLVPVEAVRALLTPFVAGLDALLGRIHDCSSVCVVASPPPKQESLVRAGIAKEPGYVKAAKDRGLDIATAPITPLHLRVSLWRIYQDLLLEIAQRHRALFVSVPRAAMNDDGSLRLDLSASDATHGNAPYGAMMWNEIFATVLGAREAKPIS